MHRCDTARVCGLLIAALAAAGAGAQDWKPTKNVDIVVSSGAGGAADRQARVVQKFLQAMPGIPSVTVTNRPGGGGTIAHHFIMQQTADAHYLGILSTGLLTNSIVGLSKISYRDITPLNILMHDYVAVWVHSGSPVKSAADLLVRMKADPKSLSLGFSTAPGNQNHVVIGMFARAAGVDPKALKTVIYASGGQGTTAALGGHVDVWFGTASSRTFRRFANRVSTRFITRGAVSSPRKGSRRRRSHSGIRPSRSSCRTRNGRR
jgi:putative tricarboxylic transport membrane protein